MPKENIYNLPNFLSAYRLLALPFMVWTLLISQENTFILLLAINLITDILDGFIARRWNLQTKFGAKLDSLGDMGTYIVAVCGIFIFHRKFVSENSIPLIILISLYILPQLISLIRFKSLPSLHLLSAKIVAYLQGIFIFIFFLTGFTSWFFWLTLILSYLSYIEETLILLVLPKLQSNAKSLAFVLKNRGIRK